MHEYRHINSIKCDAEINYKLVKRYRPKIENGHILKIPLSHGKALCKYKSYLYALEQSGICFVQVVNV